jgi:hypothetical protein
MGKGSRVVLGARLRARALVECVSGDSVAGIPPAVAGDVPPWALLVVSPCGCAGAREKGSREVRWVREGVRVRTELVGGQN